MRTRAGYYGLTDEKPDEKPVGPTAERNRMNKALVSPFAANEMEVRLTSLFAADPVRGSLLRNARLQLGSALTPGEYVIQIVVEDHVARRTATQVMPFEVIK